MKTFSFLRDMRAKELKTGKVYSKNNITIFYSANSFTVSTFADGVKSFPTLKQTINHIRKNFY